MLTWLAIQILLYYQHTHNLMSMHVLHISKNHKLHQKLQIQLWTSVAWVYDFWYPLVLVFVYISKPENRQFQVFWGEIRIKGTTNSSISKTSKNHWASQKNWQFYRWSFDLFQIVWEPWLNILDATILVFLFFLFKVFMNLMKQPDTHWVFGAVSNTHPTPLRISVCI